MSKRHDRKYSGQYRAETSQECDRLPPNFNPDESGSIMPTEANQSTGVLEAIRPHKYVPRPLITQFSDDPKEIMKGMRTPFITKLGEEYNDPDVVPVAYYNSSVDIEQ